MTTSSHPSASEGAASFDRLHPEIRRWIWEQKWDELRDVQDRTIGAVLDGDGDVLVSAATAAGKTEAAFLPVLTAVANREEPGLSILYVSPLKALINDQFGRLDQLCERLEIDVVRWHGDAPQSAKDRARRNPRGVALITPESIEALFVRRPAEARKLLGALDFIVIDELHAFMKGPRGLHLSSLLRRIDAMSKKRARRIGLSATIGDLAIAAAWLAPERPETVALVESPGGAPELLLQVRGYLERPKVDDPDAMEADEGEGEPIALDHIADHMFSTLRGANNLVFGGSRRRVESVADRLRRRCEAAGVPNEFFPHHGSLAKGLREELEARLKMGDLPTTGVATTTLELGIDIGSVKSVAQVGAPRSLASLRQRLGRSGRRKGAAAVLRIYVREHVVTADSDPLERLRTDVVMSVAAVRLLLARFVEPPTVDPSVATVVLHQVLSIIAERGGARASELYAAVCGPGPLSGFGKADFVELLRSMASQEAKLLEQAPDGTIMLGEKGEQLTTGRDFYAIFPSDEEWRLVAGGRTLGTIPIANAVGVGSLVAFAGQRWRVTAVDDRSNVLEVEIHRSAKVPKFDGKANEPLHDRLLAEMFEVYRSGDVPAFLDPVAKVMLAEGRDAFEEYGLAETRFVASGRDVHVLLWRGTEFCAVFSIALQSAGLEVEVNDLGVTVANATVEEVRGMVADLAAMPPIAAADLAEFVENLRTAKYDEFVPETLLRRFWAQDRETLVSEIQLGAQTLLSESSENI